MIVDKKKIEEFIAGYEKLCSDLGVYLVFEVDEYWLTHAGEQLDIDEAIGSMEGELLSQYE